MAPLSSSSSQPAESSASLPAASAKPLPAPAGSTGTPLGSGPASGPEKPGGAGAPSLTRSQELVLKRIRDVPALPEVVNQIILLLGKPTTSAVEIAKLIAYDPGLTSRVLRMVNSAAYGFQRQISSIQHGIMILGFNTVRGLVLSASIFKLMKSDSKSTGFDSQAFWTHSLLTAMVATQVCDTYELKQKDEAFSAGMLHDVGKLVLAQYFAQDYVAVLRHARQIQQTPHGLKFLWLEQQMMGMTHTDIGTHLADKWKLPTALAETVRFHHHPGEAELHPQLVYSVALANQVAAVWQDGQPLTLEGLSADVREYFSLESETDLAFLADNRDRLMEQLNDLQKSFQQSS